MKYTQIQNNIIRTTFNSPEIMTFLNESEKYIFKQNKTIGFRKDKSIQKFVGLRDGYSKQLEFTIESIIIDGKEKVRNKKQEFNNINEVNNVIIHELDDIKLYNRVDTTNYKNLVKIENECQKVIITYSVDLKGMKISNKSYKSNGKIFYTDNTFKQFTIVDDGNGIVLFVIDKPSVFTTENMILDIVKHELYEEDGVLYYKKYVNNLKHYLNDFVKLPLYIDANIQFKNNTYYTLTKTASNILLTKDKVDGYKNWIDFLSDFNVGSYINNVNSVDLCNMDKGNPVKINEITSYEFVNRVSLSRHIFNYDVSKLFSLGDVNIIKAQFVFPPYTRTEDSTTLVLQKCNFNGDIPNITDWDSFTGEPYKYINNNNTINDNYELMFNNNFLVNNKVQIPIQDITTKGANFMLRLYYDYTYDEVNPNVIYKNYNFLSDIIKESALEIDFTITLKDKKTIEFDVVNDGSFGVLESKSEDYQIALSGSSSKISIVNKSYNGTFLKAFGYIHTPIPLNPIDKHKIYRSYFSFDTSIYSNYKDVVVRNITLSFVSYITRSQKVSVFIKTSDMSFEISDNNLETWDYSDYIYVDDVKISNIGSTTNININTNLINLSKYVSFVFIDYLSDYLEDDTDSSITGIDFNTLKLNIDIEPYLVQGIEYKQIEKGKITTLSASKNTNSPYFVIGWFSDYKLKNRIGTGDTILLNSNLYNNGDKIYAAIFKYDEKVSINTLTILLDIYENIYDIISLKKRGTYDVNNDDSGLVDLNVINIDSMYFKYHNSIDGVCYSYARSIDNIYENNINVGDGDENGTYNMYSTFDIINKFYSNVKYVEVATKLNDIDLNIAYDKIDNVLLHEGSRVLLYSTTPSVLDGVYVLNNKKFLVKSNECDTEENAFRCKYNVKGGTYLDYEFHTYHYDSTLESPLDDDFDYNMFDSSLYSDKIKNIGTYYDRLYKNKK